MTETRGGRGARRRATPDEVRRHVESGKRASCFLLHGEEAYGRDRLYRWLLERLRPQTASDFNLDVFHADGLAAERVLDVYYAYPMMAPHRVVVIRGAERLTPAHCKSLEPLVDEPAETSVLVVAGGKLDLRRRLFAQLVRQGLAVEFRVPFDDQLPSIIRDMAAERGLQLLPEAVDRLRIYVGPQLAEMANDLDKLALYTRGQSVAITADHVEELVGVTRGASVFDFTDAVGRADRIRAVALLHELLEQGEEPNRILPMLTRHLLLLLKAQRLERQRVPPEEMAQQLGISRYFLNSYREQAGAVSTGLVWRGLGVLRRADDLLKSGGGRARNRAVMDLCLSALIPATTR